MNEPTHYLIDKKAFDPYWNSQEAALVSMIEAGHIIEVEGLINPKQIDYEAAIQFALSEVKKGLVYTETEYDAAMRGQVQGIVDAALGVGKDKT